ncbi:type VI secretion system membrane subunit TssM [Aliamphritea spongicola]|uniref:type VI secretion system membrane subunit TssM n=1 Tax=Aliamphritea spongicola TaxID=707589 RepID=UPI00196AB14F|nr:type VI secretion system membrane subunit TssM [Aliamphritea spongicola]
MAKKSRPLWPFILVTVLIGVCLFGGAYLLQFWTFASPVEMTVSGLTALLLAVMAGGLSWKFWGQAEAPEEDAEQRQREDKRNYLQQQTDLHLQACWQHVRQLRGSPYTLPWYFMLNREPGDAELLQHMGFDKIKLESTTQPLPVAFWLNESAILIELHGDADADSVEFCQQLLVKHLAKQRPRQGANGILLSVPVQDVMNRSSDQLEALAKQQRGFIKTLNQAFGVSLPVYSLFTEVSAVSDFCQFFASFDEQQLEQSFGAMLPADKHGFDPQWFDSSFDALQEQLSLNSTPALSAQLAESYRSAVIAGPHQFGLLKADLASYFRQLFLDNQYQTEALQFRGYFFVNAHGEGLPTDRLTMHLASRLGYSTLLPAGNDVVPHQLFARQLMQQNILPEKSLVGVNRYKESSYSLLKLVFSVGLLAVLGACLWLFKANYDYYTAMEQEAAQQLTAYKRQLINNKDQSDELAVPIANLTELRKIRAIFHRPEPWYAMSFLPNPSIKKAVDGAYDDALKDQLLIELRDYLLRDLYVYNRLDDKVKTLELYNLQKQLFNARRTDVNSLSNYYLNSLQEEGVTDSRLINQFKLLLSDLFALKVAPPKDNQELLELVDQSLATQDLGDLLYTQLLQQPHLSQKLNLLDKLGQNYDDVFTFKDDSVYNVPYMFTREGFLEIMGSSGFEFANDWVADYKDVVGDISGNQDFSQINRKLRLRYTRDYVEHWQRFASALEWQPTTGWSEISQQLISATDPASSPLLRVYELLDYHTSLEAAVEGVLKAQEAAKAKPADADAGAPADNPLAPADLQTPAKHLGITQAAETIARPFAPYKRLIQPDDKGVSPLGFATQHMTATLEWLQQGVQSKQRGNKFLGQLNGEVNNPLQRQLDIAVKYNGVVRDMLEHTARQLNDLAMLEVQGFLQQRWQAEVLNDYLQSVAPYYPVNPLSDQDIPLATFKEFFAADGRISDFAKRYEPYFTDKENIYPGLPSFLQDQDITINRQFWLMLGRLKQVQAVMFNNGVPGFNFSVRIDAMSSGVTEFNLRSDKPLYTYRNGPALWAKMNWPVSENSSRTLSLQLKGSTKVLSEASFPGIWSWFRMVDQLQGESLPDGSTNSLTWQDGQESASLLARTESGENPLYVGFFDQLQLPERL